MRNITRIFIHCAATIEGRDHDIKEIAKWHLARGFKQVGYHYVVKLDGTVQIGRPEELAGAHVEGFNKDSIGVCYVGGLGLDGKPKDTRTQAQKKALATLLQQLKKKYPNAIILGHRDVSKDLNKNGTIEPIEWMKACPSFNAKTEYARL